MQSRNGGFGAFDANCDKTFLNEVPFADHGALLDPPTADVSARCVSLLAALGGADTGYRATLDKCVRYLSRQQEDSGAWFGRWGCNYIYGTWSALTALSDAGIAPADSRISRGADWLEQRQNPDGGWGESNASYGDPSLAGNGPSTSFQTAWALLGLMAAGRTQTQSVRRGVNYLVRTQQQDGFWHEPWFTAAGFPRVFYLKYHGYSIYFPVLALARYQNLSGNGRARAALHAP
jgi:squalene-hopene/tetraprenyl-beta-curcumene cyclase